MEHEPGTILKNRDGHVVMRMGPGVTVGKYFAIHPDHGGGFIPDLPGEPEDWVEGTFPDFPEEPTG